ncbi:hypothetical protein [Undibacterium sp. Xuan67W]|uniref:hypothetical protein n=1 Tax=Undibacterium sp. Xuan67W TaxID=3413057 RepID=UPI003BF148A3
MNKITLAARFTCIFFLCTSATAWANDPIGSSAIGSNVTKKQSLHQIVSKAMEYKSKNVIVSSKLHQISVSLANGSMNENTPEERKLDATKVASLIENAIMNQEKYADVTIIHINYIKRVTNHNTLIQGYDFIQTPAGVFVLNKS